MTQVMEQKLLVLDKKIHGSIKKNEHWSKCASQHCGARLQYSEVDIVKYNQLTRLRTGSRVEKETAIPRRVQFGESGAKRNVGQVGNPSGHDTRLLKIVASDKVMEFQSRPGAPAVGCCSKKFVLLKNDGIDADGFYFTVRGKMADKN